MEGLELASEVTTPTPYVVPAVGERRFRVAAIDFGMKRSIVRYLAEEGVEVHVLPSTTTPDEIRALEPDGLFLSNGPGDPATVAAGIATTGGVAR
jgi:carbamoyl-phosphate synthase small subunit